MGDTPFPYLPQWRARLGALTVQGEGLLSREVFNQLGLVDEMTVAEITVKPKLGEIWTGNALESKTAPGKLLWFRRMFKDLGTQDNNSRPAQCLFYGLGLQMAGGEKIGWRLFEDGTARKGEIA